MPVKHQQPVSLYTYLVRHIVNVSTKVTECQSNTFITKYYTYTIIMFLLCYFFTSLTNSQRTIVYLNFLLEASVI